MMVFLVAMAAVWFALAMERAIPWWTLWLIGPTVILPMALGSVAMFVVFLPLAVFLLMVRATMQGRGPRPGGLAGLLVILAVAGWGARSFAVAPPCAGCASAVRASGIPLGWIGGSINSWPACGTVKLWIPRPCLIIEHESFSSGGSRRQLAI